jgi:hypothetical protein
LDDVSIANEFWCSDGQLSDIFGNSISGKIPDSFANLRELKFLYAL